MTHVMAKPKTSWGSLLFRWDAQRRLRKTFSRCLVRGLPGLAARLEQEPVILALNHVSFWDAFLLPCVEGAVAADGYCLMDRDNLQNLAFLRFAGAVPVDLRDARRAQSDLDHAARLLDRPGRLLFVFPQGVQVPAHLPLRFRTGVLRLAERTQLPIVPAGLRYEFLGDPKPEIRLSIGAPVAVDGARAASRRRLEAATRAELDLIDASLASGSSELLGTFTSLFPEAPQGLPAGSRLLARASARRLT